MKIALLGAESTGKTWLSQALAAHYQAQGGHVHAAPEVLRLWCDAHQRTPQAHEQAAIAHDQATAIMASPPGTTHWVADTSPLMTAVYSDLLFGDTSLYAMALAHQSWYDLTLVTGLDLPWVADVQRDGPHVREPVTRAVRAALDQAGLPYRVVYGRGEQRLHNALIAIESIAKNIHPTRGEQQKALENGRRAWRCEHCSDPDCERRLFSALIA